MKSLMILFLVTLLASNNNPDAILGKWYTENNEGVVEVYKQDQKYYGTLISLKTPNDSQGQPRKDSKNPDAKLKNRNLIGIPIFWNMEYSSKNKRWENGIFYDPDMGHQAKGFITVIDNNTIRVKGYVGFEWISKSQVWKRKN